jgi:tetraacyldisaccharide 4'-kinase
VAQWFAAQLAARGARPAILLRGYGNDEGLVHRALMPGAIVVENADRIAGANEAQRRGADMLVLDDAFQHRQVERSGDVVLISADAQEVSWPLPAGPLREPFASVRRADLVIITQKAASDADVDRMVARVHDAAPHVPIAVARLTSDELVEWSSRRTSPLRAHAGTPVLAVSGVGDPGAFEKQLSNAGLTIFPARFDDHHPYSAADATNLIARVPQGGLVVCTLKDAVKLGPVWPRQAPSLWYVSQRVSLVRGAEFVAGLLDAALALRPTPVVPPNL